MFIASGLDKSLWGFGLLYATWMKNRIPHKAIESEGKTPYEMVYGEKPDLSRAREWGCRIFVNAKGKDKFDARALEGRYLGPSHETSDGFHVYWPKTGRVTVERSVRFLDGSSFEGEQNTPKDIANDDLNRRTHPRPPHPSLQPLQNHPKPRLHRRQRRLPLPTKFMTLWKGSKPPKRRKAALVAVSASRLV